MLCRDSNTVLKQPDGNRLSYWQNSKRDLTWRDLNRK